MAALRLSIKDVNSQLMHELVLKDRKLIKRLESNPTNIRNHPVQEENPDVETFQQSERKRVVEVYRRKKPDRINGEYKVAQKARGNNVSVTGSDIISHLDTKPLEENGILRKQNAPSYEKTQSVQENVKPRGVLTKTNPPSAGQKRNYVKLPTDATKDHQIPPEIPQLDPEKPQHVLSNNTLKKTVALNNNPAARSPKPSIQKVLMDEKRKLVNKTVTAKPPHRPLNASDIQPGKLLDSRHVKKQGGLHKVMSLDVTLKPRDAHAQGQFGWAAQLPSENEEESKRRWSEGYFNVFLSEQIPVDRAIPDTRPTACSQNHVHDDLPTTSVIFCFVDEDKLDAYMAQFPKVRIIRLKERHGLIRARLAGAAEAKGDVLTFLDSHIECNVGWLEPLLDRVYLDRRKVACPVIEVINDKDLSYVMVDNFQRGIFNWPLVFGWNTLSNDYIRKNHIKDSDPIR
ncbi:Polypeptide N-acetylgalactosaminyltransferase 5 [Bagarius yarrelli]|uniref:Polypeptide N-acetylgalactosaminyltransferase 5 n=1 Tax=Bagarius yarrelli TaxID=175774 RepID=A0A556U030_BAGYA|nr:Polypeptide N-acetylgalactosaminyltransferase 5 [Bagarius yarrelli]